MTSDPIKLRKHEKSIKVTPLVEPEELEQVEQPVGPKARTKIKNPQDTIETDPRKQLPASIRNV